MRKYISFITMLAIILCSVAAHAKTDYSVTSSSRVKMSAVQGTDGWYFTAFPDGVREDLVYYPENTRWKLANGEQYPTVKGDLMLPGNTVDCGYVYEVEKGGVVSIKGSVRLTSASVEMTISKNGTKTVWSKKDSTAKDTTKDVDYDVLTVVKPGDEIWFRVGADGANTNDFTTWWPSVEYTSLEYIPIEDEDIDLEYDYNECFEENSLWSLKYNDKDGFADMTWDNRDEKYVVKALSGGTASLDKNAMMPTRACAVSAVWTAPYSGTVSLNASPKGISDDNSVYRAKIIKNAEKAELSETIWQEEITGIEGADCTISVNVSAGDSIYFMAENLRSSIQGISFKPSIEYTQSAIFTEDGEILKSMSEAEEDDSIYVELRGYGNISKDFMLMLALYDNDGNMRSLSVPETFSMSDSEILKIHKGVKMNFNKQSYEGWKLSLLIWNIEDGRFYSVRQTEEIALK